MKTKILSLVLVLSVVLSLAIVAPASAATSSGTSTPNITAAYSAQPPEYTGPFDEAYVSTAGNDSFDGSAAHPWRTITHAVNQLPYTGAAGDPPGSGSRPDRINVHSVTGSYGGPGSNAEHIVIHYPVVLRAYNWDSGTADRNNTKVKVDGQDGPDNIIEIVSDVVAIGNPYGVTIDGLCLSSTGVAKDGIYAHNGGKAISHVVVKNCLILIDQVETATGIEMQGVKYPCINSNIIQVGTEQQGLTLSVQDAIGILLVDCGPGVVDSVSYDTCVTNNIIDAKGSSMAEGIVVQNSPKTTVDGNDLDVQAGGDAIGIGIEAENSPLVQITNNVNVDVLVNAYTFGLGFGIKVKSSDRANIDGNTVNLSLITENNVLGFLWGIGIWLKNSNESCINNNPVAVTGIGTFNSNTTSFSVPNDEDFDADLADINEIINATQGKFIGTVGAAVVIGIKVSGGCLDKVTDNDDVVVKLAADFFAGGNEETAFSGGAGVAFGILGCHSSKLVVGGNNVDIDKAVSESQRPADVMVNVRVWQVEAAALDVGVGMGLNLALGIALDGCELGMVTANHVSAKGSMYVEVETVPNVGGLEESSALAVLNSEVLSSIYQSVTDATGSESINAQFDGDPPSIATFDLGGGICSGIAIVVLASPGVCVAGNTLAEGVGNLSGKTWSQTRPGNEAEAWGAGVGLGGGVLVICSPSVKVDDNAGVSGTGLADISIGAQHTNLLLDAEAYGGGAGIGFGIFIIGSVQYGADAGEVALDSIPGAPGGPMWDGQTQVINNGVTATGSADKIVVCADDLNPNEAAIGIGVGLGLALGITAVWSPCILIQGNVVDAEAYAKVCVGSRAIDSFDPLSVGGAAGVGIGIASIASFRSQIIGNTSTGTGTAEGFVISIEKPIPALSPAAAFGGTLGFGTGILVFGSYGSLVQGNPVANGLADAQTLVAAVNTVPLDSAFALALAAGLGNGIAVVCSPWTDVVDCNTAAGVGTARVCDWASADFDYAYKLGVAASVDILMFLDPDTKSIRESDFDAIAEHFRYKFGKVNYNSMVDVSALGDNGQCIVIIDAGLLKIGWPCLDAQFNWWNDPTGPSGFGPGTGEAVLWCGKDVIFSPWLYVVHTKVLDDQIGYFGFYYELCKGVNAISTPVRLSDGSDPDGAAIPASMTWSQIKANSHLTQDGPNADIKYAIKWVTSDPADATTGHWEMVGPDDPLNPLYAWYVYVRSDCKNLILLTDADGYPSSHMPSRTLARGWNLFGSNPPEFTQDCIGVGVMMTTAEVRADNLPGYTVVVSPGVACQDAWVYTINMDDWAKVLKSGRGYWVNVLNPIILYGYGFSPLRDKPFDTH